MKKTVFISSTFEDLKEYRKVVWNVLEKQDVYVNGMERFGARKSTPLETCLEEIRNSDIYIGIIGMVYGSIETNSGKSYTQLEYEEAIINNLDIHIYLIDEGKTKFYIRHIDFKNYKKLLKFKLILREHTVKFFSDPIELSNSIKTNLNKATNSLVISRPKYLNAKIFRFMRGTEEMNLLIGYYKKRAFELWIQPSDSLLFPKYVNDCIITEVRQPKLRTMYDCSYLDNQDYLIVIPAIDRISYNMNEGIYNLINSISALLSENTSLLFILEFVEKCYFSDKENNKAKNKISEILINNSILKMQNNKLAKLFDL